MLIIMLVEIEPSEIVISRREVRRKLQHGPILFDRRSVISALLSSFGLCVKRLNLGCDFVIGRGLGECCSGHHGNERQRRKTQSNLIAGLRALGIRGFIAESL